MTSTLSEKLSGLLGRDALVNPGVLGDYSVDGIIPQAVVQPSSRKAIAEVLRWATSEKLAVVPRGGGTQLCLGNLPSRVDLVLDLSRCNKLLDYQPADLTATVEAGISLEALQSELAQGGKLVPLEAPLSDKATVGGVLAASASGPLRYSYGLARDWLIGISVIGANGQETKAGGKVVKNVTGYDLNKLYTGSLGTLGVIVEATFKLAPVPTDSGALVAVFSSLPEAIEKARELLKQFYAPQGIQVVNAAAGQKLDLPASLSDREAAVVGFYAGRSRAVQRRLDESASFLRNRDAGGLERLDAPSASQLLRQLTDLGWSSDTRPQLGLKVDLPPLAVGRLAVGSSVRLPGLVADPGFGQAHFFWWPRPDSPELEDDAAANLVSEVRKVAGDLGGSVVVEHCSRSLKERLDIWGEPGGLMGLMAQIKQRFDPEGVLNPGRFMGKL